MIPRLTEENIREHLTAFTDGELDAAQTIEVLDHLAAHPESLRLLAEQQNLRLAVQRMILTETPPASAALHARINRMAADARSGNAWRIWSWLRRVGS